MKGFIRLAKSALHVAYHIAGPDLARFPIYIRSDERGDIPKSHDALSDCDEGRCGLLKHVLPPRR